MKSQPIGVDANGASVLIDTAELIRTRMLIQGASGSGKSHTVRRLLESTHGRVQHFVLDVEDEYSSMRDRYEYVLAGPGRDCPVDIKSAGLLATRLLEMGTSAIINLYDTKPRDRATFMRIFIDALMSAPKSARRDALVVVEECSVWAPQSGRESESTQSVIDLAARGRKRGLCLVAVTQRISDLHKSVVAQCQNRLIGKTTLDTDVKRAAYELGFGDKDLVRSLVTLPKGSFYAFGPAISDVVRKVKIGQNETGNHRNDGDRPTPPPQSSVRSAIEKLADLPRAAEEKARTIDEMTAEISELRRNLAAANRDRKIEEKIVQVPVLTDEQAREIGIAAKTIQSLVDSAIALNETFAGVTLAVSRSAAKKTPPAMILDLRETKARDVEVAPSTSYPIDQSLTHNLGAERKLLVELVKRYPFDLTKKQLATLCVMQSRGGTFQTYLSRLRSNGLIESIGDVLKATREGLASIDLSREPVEHRSVLEIWIEKIGRNAAGKLIVALAENPLGMTKSDLAAKCGMSENGGTFQTYLSRIRSNGLIESGPNGSIRLTGEALGS